MIGLTLGFPNLSQFGVEQGVQDGAVEIVRAAGYADDGDAQGCGLGGHGLGSPCVRCLATSLVKQDRYE